MAGISYRWGYKSKRSLTKLYGKVEVFGDHVLGQWFCLDRVNGKLLWESNPLRANSVVGVSDFIVVATECRSDAPATYCYGCYGIHIETGAVEWISHARGWPNKILAALDFLPFYSNAFRDEPIAVLAGEVICRSGRILDVRTGKDIRLEEIADPARYTKEETLSEQLYTTSMRFEFDKVRVAPGRYLSHQPGPVSLPAHIQEKLNTGSVDEIDTDELFRYRSGASQYFQIFCLNGENQVLWNYSLEGKDYHISGNYYSYRLHRGKIYLIVSQEPPTILISPDRPDVTKRHPVYFQLLELNIETGEIDRQVTVLDRKLTSCDIQCTCGNDIFVRCNDNELACYSIA
jgi:hypothetical protein